ncbi:putative LOC102086138 [Columba livia]|uniref:Mitochondrial nucleoid factor 1 n=1 Tax=Columba livia TaxID=8932 RepID=A0A2I0LNK9_COLLI|nr:uncharacterized protein LOC102086138 [Columba livia]PKK19023.1 putative LOC102086138 [Columba livia]
MAMYSKPGLWFCGRGAGRTAAYSGFRVHSGNDVSRYSCGPSWWEAEGEESVQRCGAASWGRQHRTALRSRRSGSGLSSRKPRNYFFLLWGFKIQLCDTSVLFQIADPEACDQMYESLVRIHTNYYKNKYPRLKDTSFTGVTVEDCKMILATDVLKQMEDMKKGTWRKLRERFYAKKPEEDLK